MGILLGLAAQSAVAQTPAPNQWQQPAANLADQIAAILGPGQARLTIRNLSTISNDEIPAIRRLLVQDLKTHGITVSGAESASIIRVTLSHDWLDGLWVAEIGEGSETQVAMVNAGLARSVSADLNKQERVTLRKQLEWATDESLPLQLPPALGLGEDRVLAAGYGSQQLVALSEDGVATYAMGLGTWSLQKQIPFPERNSLPRDPRGIVVPAANGNGFTAFTAGLECAGSYSIPADPAAMVHGAGWTLQCHASDDPWPIASDASGAPQLSAFYNSARNYFTGVVTPSIGVDLPPFYSAALVPRSAGNGALLVGGIDGKVQLAENGALNNVAGTRDWGSDFAVMHPGCGAGTEIIASGSGEAANDSLRAYELPALEAVPASAPLAIDGTVTALWTEPDGKSVLAVVRSAANQYEVDRVTALCN